MHHPSNSKPLYKPPPQIPQRPQQHHRLPPTSTTSNPSVLTSGPQNPRLNELFDLIQNEFEATGQDGAMWRAQRDEYEQKMQVQINELGLIRQSLYELESQHQRVREHYEAEIARLKRELEARGGSAAAIAGPGSPSRLGESDRPSYPRPELPGSLAGGGPPPLNGESGRSPYPPPAGAGAVSTDRRERPHPTSPPSLLSDLDPENVSRELKKEGSDWFAVWSSQSKKQLDVSLVHTLSHETVVCCVKFSHDGKYLATGCNRTAQIYDVKDGRKVSVLLDETNNRAGDLYIRSICFSPDGKYLATGAEDRQIRIWDIKQKRIRHLLQGHMQEIYSLDFSRDGRFLVSGSGDKSARVWDIEKGQCVVDLRIEDFIHNEHGPIDAGITSVALSPDGKLVAAGSLDTMVRVWNVQTGQQVERLKGHKDSVYSVAFSPDGKTLVSGSLDRTLRVWDLTQTKRAVENAPPGSKDVDKGLGVCQSTLNGHKDYVLSVAVSPDGQWVVSGSKDRSIQFWSVASGQAQFMLQGHKNSVISIDLAKTGNHLASGSGDCMARIWKYEPLDGGR
ncbi:WD40-repeat-containing domain protein [Kockovaella imperatae]|uniref:WD40-repeat-containing domain protein n=1 Tax=Kockovaella imperatae TaxID=4999 RepID=A0A1Y1UKY4_9TREE|nr:WD40-repeat-containing domain protein [Kockovaella imperatae]ORX38718.1 WD40-repeat-containing domain protein [Kockovaella imperatae]